MTVETEPLYCSTAELVPEFEVDSETIPDDAVALRTILDAEDLIDRILGGWYGTPNEQTGRKVTKGDVMAWQWSKLPRATVKLAVRLYNDPSVLEQIYEATRGPDFSMQGPKGGALVHMIGVQVLALLDDSGLRRIAGRGRAGRRYRIKPAYQRFLAATRHDGT